MITFLIRERGIKLYAKNRGNLTIIVLCTTLVSCTKKPLGTLSVAQDSQVVYSMQNEFYYMSLIKDVEEGTEVTCTLDEENSKVIITLTKGDKTETIEKSVKIEYPLWEQPSEPIIIDTYTGYDINQLLTLREGVQIICHELNGNILTVILSDGEREETFNIEAEII